MRELKLLLTASAIVLGTISHGFGDNLNPERRGIGIEGIHGANVKENEAAKSSIVIDQMRSLFVTHEKTLAVFSLAEVMDKLASEGEPGLTGEELFHRLWDTNNLKADAVFHDQDEHCDSETPAVDGASKLNGFPYTCPRPEGAEARNGTVNDYIPIAAVNRLDLAGGDSCGEFRLVFARRSGTTVGDLRNLIIFEMEVPNPKPGPDTGSLGCKPIAEFWANLGQEADAVRRGIALWKFYFVGKTEFFGGETHFAAPVSVKRLGGDPARPLGQIRTNQFAPGLGQPAPWILRQYRLDTTGGKLRPVRQNVAHNPDPSLFAVKAGDARQADAEALAAAIASDLDRLARSRETFDVSLPETLNAGESDEQDAKKGNVLANFMPDSIVGKAIGDALAAKPALRMTSEQVVARVGALTCSGCHTFISNRSLGQGSTGVDQLWPKKDLLFVHVSEAKREDCEGEIMGCFAISSTLRELFLPAREDLLKDMLTKTLF